MRMWLYFILFISIGSFSSVGLSAGLFKSDLLQPTVLQAPKAGNIAGAYSGFGITAEDLRRGALSIDFPYSLSQLRGNLHVNPLPTYSHRGRLTEWGMGWQNNLEITRYNAEHDIDYKTDTLMSPWGELLLGTDGFWYPRGFSAPVRVRVVGSDITAYLPDGVTLFYGKSDVFVSSRGIYSWFLYRAEDKLGKVTSYRYTRTNDHRPLLQEVQYFKHSKSQYKIEFIYSDLGSKSLVSYASSAKDSISQKVAEVVFYLNHPKTEYDSGKWSWKLVLEHERVNAGPVFFLTQIQKIYASGEVEPPVKFTYDTINDFLPYAERQHTEKLRKATADANAEGFYAGTIEFYDANEDGLIDIERGRDLKTYIQSGDEFIEGDDHYRADFDKVCQRGGHELRYRANDNKRRNLTRIHGRLAPYQDVLFSLPFGASYRLGEGETTLHVCSVDGKEVEKVNLKYNFGARSEAPNGFIKFVDLNNDGLPDVLKIRVRDFAYVRNESTADKLQFSDPVFVPYNAEFLTRGVSFVFDMNGDGLTDIVIRGSQGVYVFFGKGNFIWGPERVWIPIRFKDGMAVDVEKYEMTPVDINRDGLTDLLFNRGQTVYAFINKGDSFEGITVPGLKNRHPNAGYPRLLDITGTGNAQVTMLNGERGVDTLQLNRPSTGLLTKIDNGKGVSISWTYKMTDPALGVRNRYIVVGEQIKTIAGQGSEKTSFTYHKPIVDHRINQLLGFSKIEKTSSLIAEEHEFLLSSDHRPLPLKTVVIDRQTMGPKKIHESAWVNQTFEGISYPQLASTLTAWQTDVKQSPGVRTVYDTYSRFCPSSYRRQTAEGELQVDLKYFSHPSFADHLICWKTQERANGRHIKNSAMDFTHGISLDRNDRGQVEQLLLFGSNAEENTSVIQQAFYNDRSELASLVVPGRGATTYQYDDKTGLLSSIMDPTGKVELVKYSQDDLVTEIDFDRSGSVYKQEFDYDGQNRLYKAWDNLTQTSMEKPLTEFYYRDVSATSPGTVKTHMLTETAFGSISSAERLEFFDAAGSLVTEAKQNSSGWTFSDLRSHHIDRGISSRFRLADEVANPQNWSFDDLSSEAKLVAERHNSELYGLTLEKTKITENMLRSLSFVPTLNEELQTERLENDEFSQVMRKDALGNAQSFTDEEGHKHSYQYDLLGRLRQIQTPNGGTHHITLNDYGDVIKIERSELGSVTFSYDPVTRLLLTKSYYDRVGILDRSEAFSYDSKTGRLVSRELTKKGQKEIFRYLYDGFVPGAKKAIPGQTGFLSAVEGKSFTKMFSYRTDGKLLQEKLELVDWGAITHTFNYALHGEIKSVGVKVERVGLGQKTYERKLTYNEFGQLSQVDLGSKVLDISYNAAAQIDNIIVQGIKEDVCTNMIATHNPLVAAYSCAITPHIQKDQQEGYRFAYDPLTRRLLTYSFQNLKQSWDYVWQFDKRGFVAQEAFRKEGQELAKSFAYNPRGMLAQVAGTISEEHLYDDVGFHTHKADASGSLDFTNLYAEGKLLVTGQALELDSSNRLVRNAKGTFLYGPSGQIEKARVKDGEVNYIYDEEGQQLVKAKNGVVEMVRFGDVVIIGNDIIEPLTIGDVTLGVIKNGEFVALPFDARGSALEANSAQQSSAFGYRKEHGEFSSVEFALQGYDADTGMIRMGARDYDPVLGRFVTPDLVFLEDPELCVEDPVSCNLFSYARNNPLKYVDPSGNIPIFPAILGSLWLTDKATTAYEAFSDYKAVSTGESTLAEVGQRRGVEWAAGAVLGLGGRGLVKVLKAAIPSSSMRAAKSLWGGNANSKNWKEWTITNPEKTVHHPKFKNIHKDSNTGNWWSKDTAGHGESKWKIFRETKKGLEWVADADKHGNFMPGKHKGDIGKFIPWKEISKVK